MENTLQIATFAGGCFWCTEAVFIRINGVEKVVSGYTGGFIKNPPYREVCAGTTGHTEGVQIYFDKSKVSYFELLEVFFATHDPTTLNRQGNDVGTQYRSAIFYNTDEQKSTGEEFIKFLNDKNIFNKSIVTEINKLDVFYEAEEVHQEYYDNNKEASYCQFIINPKIKRLNTHFQDKLKQNQNNLT